MWIDETGFIYSILQISNFNAPEWNEKVTQTSRQLKCIHISVSRV